MRFYPIPSVIAMVYLVRYEQCSLLLSGHLCLDLQEWRRKQILDGERGEEDIGMVCFCDCLLWAI